MRLQFTFLLSLLLLGFGESTLLAQQAIYGNVTDELGSPVIGGTIKILRGENFITGTATDFNGNYRINIDPGTYNVEFSYVGFRPILVKTVDVLPGVEVLLNNQFSDQGASLEEVVVMTYTVDPMEVDETSQGLTLTLTSKDRKKLGTRNINAIASMSAGATSAQEGDAVRLRGGRRYKTQYTIDGIRIVGAQKPGHSTYREPTPKHSGEDYRSFTENLFQLPQNEPLSTFGADVDVAAYANVRRFLNQGQMAPSDAVRTEELINYFSYDYPQPEGKDPVSITTELGDCPWNENHQLLHIGLQAKELDVDNLPPSNLVFLIDVSGSMNSQDKLPLLKEAYRLLVPQLRAEDKVSIVTYAGNAGLVLEPTSGDQKEVILAAIDKLSSGGSTAGAAGILLAYQLAEKHFNKGGNNRIILATDGDFNVGTTANKSLEKLVAEKRKTGVFLSVIGFGKGNYQDARMQTLAEKGNGNAAYIDNMLEARKVLVEEFGGTMFTVAKDVKLQVEFNPAQVAAYRLVGYESRLLAAEDFNDDKKDAGDMGSGHTVTALYEIIPAGGKSDFLPNVDGLKYQKPKGTDGIKYTKELATVRMKYKHPQDEKSQEKVEVTVDASSTASRSTNSGRTNTSEAFQWSASVAGWSLLLKQSDFAASFDYTTLIPMAEKARGTDVKGYRAEAIRLMETSRNLSTPAELVETGK
ncbi:MAG: von Willebrand factor type A domain-containing protein [Saprospiraceae bacterium]